MVVVPGIGIERTPSRRRYIKYLRDIRFGRRKMLSWHGDIIIYYTGIYQVYLVFYVSSNVIVKILKDVVWAQQGFYTIL